MTPLTLFSNWWNGVRRKYGDCEGTGRGVSGVKSGMMIGLDISLLPYAVAGETVCAVNTETVSLQWGSPAPARRLKSQTEHPVSEMLMSAMPHVSEVC